MTEEDIVKFGKDAEEKLKKYGNIEDIHKYLNLQSQKKSLEQSISSCQYRLELLQSKLNLKEKEIENFGIVIKDNNELQEIDDLMWDYINMILHNKNL